MRGSEKSSKALRPTTSAELASSMSTPTSEKDVSSPSESKLKTTTGRNRKIAASRLSARPGRDSCAALATSLSWPQSIIGAPR